MALLENSLPIHGGPTIEGAQLRSYRRRAVVTTAQVLALFATPITVVPAPGAGKALIFEGAVIQKPAGVAYAGIAAGENLSFKYTNAAGLEVGGCETVGFLDSTGAQLRYAQGYRADSGVSQIIPVANAVLVLHLLIAEIITGDSDLNLEVHYRVVDALP